MISYKRYVDDRFLIERDEKVDDILRTFNDEREDLKFTCDIEHDGKQRFLDTEVSVENDGSLRTNWR